jgi:hypothetical protein
MEPAQLLNLINQSPWAGRPEGLAALLPLIPASTPNPEPSQSTRPRAGAGPSRPAVLITHLRTGLDSHRFAHPARRTSDADPPEYLTSSRGERSRPTGRLLSRNPNPTYARTLPHGRPFTRQRNLP